MTLPQNTAVRYRMGMALTLLFSGLMAGCASPRMNCCDFFPSCLQFPCACHKSHKAEVCWPCYGYNPTCWSGWPICCEMCPPPASSAPSAPSAPIPRPAGAAPQVIPPPPSAEDIGSCRKDSRSIKRVSLETMEPAPFPPPLKNEVILHRQRRTRTPNDCPYCSGKDKLVNCALFIVPT